MIQPPTATGQDTAFPSAGPASITGRWVYFVGIGGCGMSGLAQLMKDHGAACSGSDAVASPLTETLENQGITVHYDQSAGALPEPCDLVVASAAIEPDQPELAAARSRGIPVLSYAEALGHLQAEQTAVCIAGTHGKSTTAAMLCHVLIECGLDPSFIIGATCPQIGGGSRVGAAVVPGEGPRAGRPGILVAEACEFNRSFHYHRPQIALINNVEEDHLDVYGNLDAIVEAFAGFAKLLPAADAGGRLVIAHEGAHRRQITAGLRCAVETFGFNPAADHHVQFDPTRAQTTVQRGGRTLARWTNRMPGPHNALNAAAAAVLASHLGADWSAIATALGSFTGIDRRMQRLGERPIRGRGGCVVVYDDYGHHPTEIDATLRALRAAEQPRRLICVFQPHQHSRTRFLLEQFAQSFSVADVVIVPHIYFVRDSELEKHRVAAADLVDRLRERGVVAMHLYPFEAIVEQLEVMCQDGDLVVIMGAGPVWQVARQFLGVRS
jgi:UDP-N-acetylmuramate--alanine ligase